MKRPGDWYVIKHAVVHPLRQACDYANEDGDCTGPVDPKPCSYDTELGITPPRICNCCEGCARDCYQNV